MDIHAAIRELRNYLGESRQVFATKLGLSMTAVQNYETDREPDSRAILSFLAAAQKLAPPRPDLEERFTQAMRDMMENAYTPGNLNGALPYQSEEEWRYMRAAQWLLRDKRFSDEERKKLAEALQPAFKHMNELGLMRRHKAEESKAKLRRIMEKQKRQKAEVQPE